MAHPVQRPRMHAVFRILELADTFPVEAVTLAELMGWSEEDVSELFGLMRRDGMVVCTASGTAVLGLGEGAPSPLPLAESLERIRRNGLQCKGTELLQAMLDGNGSRELNILNALCGELAERYSLEALHMACRLLLRRMLAINVRDRSLWQQYATTAIHAHPFTLPFFDLGPLAVRVLTKARALASGVDDLPSMAALDIILGTEVTRKPLNEPDKRFWNAGERGRRELAQLTDWDLQTRLSPYLGILDFVEGSFQNAMGHFSLRPQTISTPTERILYEQCIMYEGHSANLLGNFLLGTNILRSNIRRATAGSSYISLEHMELFLSVALIAQGELDEALELVNSLLGSARMDSDPIFRMSVYAVLAYYHRGSGRLRASYSVFRRCLEKGRAPAFYYFTYHAPYFMELLYEYKISDFPDIAGLNFDDEKERKFRDHNDMQKSVALRLMAQVMLREGGSLDAEAPARRSMQRGSGDERRIEAARKALPLLRESLELTRELGLLREKAKNCILLAWVYAELGRREEMHSLAMEAWSQVDLLQQDPWTRVLAAIIPSPQKESAPHAQNGPEQLYDTVSSALMGGEAQTLEQFHNHLLRSVCTIFGVGRVCLFAHREGTPRAQICSALRISEEEIQGAAFSSRMEFIEKCMHGEPVFTAIPDQQSRKKLIVSCIPLICSSSERYALYMDGEIFPEVGQILSRETLLYIGKMFSWEIIRFRQRPYQPPVAEERPRGEDLYSLIYSGEPMRRFLEKVEQAARSDAAIMLYGETGTGKELVARRIHEASGRRGPFIAVNLSTLPEELFESELLGYERGAFTGAMQRKMGLLELADNGTLFIDEIPDVSMRMQIKLLRILQERTFCRLGSTRSVHSNFRLITATNRDIRKDVEQGRFREDLFYRICVIPFTVPPLRTRGEDKPALLRYYMAFFARRYGKTALRDIHPDSLAWACSYDWPGNVRELKNRVEQAVITAGNEALLWIEPPLAPPLEQRAQKAETPDGRAEREFGGQEADLAVGHMLKDFLNRERTEGRPLPTLKEWENLYIEAVLDFAGRKIEGKGGAAELLGMKKANLYYRLGRMKQP